MTHWVPNPRDKTRERAQQRLQSDYKRGRPGFYIVRYADDFVVLVQGTQQDADDERWALAQFLREELRMELSMEKTKITDVREGFDFLGYRIAQEKCRRPGGMWVCCSFRRASHSFSATRSRPRYGKRRQAGPSPILSTTSIQSSRVGVTTTGTRHAPGKSLPSMTGGCGGA